MAEVSPELLVQLKAYLKQRTRGEKTSLVFFYKEVFGREPKLNCGVCVDDAAEHLKTFINNKNNKMKKFKWIGKDNATVNLKTDSGIKQVSKANCTDDNAEKISKIEKYAHLVERIAGTESEDAETETKKSEDEFEEVDMTGEGSTSGDTASTSETATNGGATAKKKRRNRR